MIQETISSRKAPKALGPYSPALRAGDFVYISGQIPVDPETGELAGDDIRTQTEQCLKNIQALLQETGLEMKHVLKTTVYMTDLNEFAEMNEVYARYFSEPYPARSAAEVSKLVRNAKVEIEAYAIDTRALEVICSKETCDADCENVCEILK